MEETGEFINIAVQGCCHGELDTIYANVLETQARTGTKIDLLLICGDFECVRDQLDLCCMAVPVKYRHLKNFHKYFSGECQAPVMTVFIGGNHEASNVLQSLYYGGFVAPNIYFLGFGGVINYKGVRIGGLSGIFNDKHYSHGHYEKPPYTEGSIRSVYHIRALEVQRMLHFPAPAIVSSDTNSSPPIPAMDIFLTHDWPAGIWEYGDVDTLLRIKPHFRQDIATNSLGSPPARKLMDHLQPPFWFAGHMHIKFPAVVPHLPIAGESVSEHRLVTRFLALDKVIPGRQYLQYLQIPITGHHVMYADDALHFDPEWTAILHKTHAELRQTRFLYRSDPVRVTDEEIEHVRRLLIAEYGSDLVIPMPVDPAFYGRFSTAADYCATCDPASSTDTAAGSQMSMPRPPAPPAPPLPPHQIQPQAQTQEGNVQTDRLLRALHLPHIWTIPYQTPSASPSTSNSRGSNQTSRNQPPPPSTPHPSDSSFAPSTTLDHGGDHAPVGGGGGEASRDGSASNSTASGRSHLIPRQVLMASSTPKSNAVTVTASVDEDPNEIDI